MEKCSPGRTINLKKTVSRSHVQPKKTVSRSHIQPKMTDLHRNSGFLGNS